MMTLTLLLLYQNLILGLQADTETIPLSLQKPISPLFSTKSRGLYLAESCCCHLEISCSCFFTLHVTCSMWNLFAAAFTFHAANTLQNPFHAVPTCGQHLVECFFCYFYITCGLSLAEFFLHHMWLVPSEILLLPFLHCICLYLTGPCPCSLFNSRGQRLS